MPSISYAITACNEHEELNRLLKQLYFNIRDIDEVIIQLDTTATEEVKEVCCRYPAFTLIEYSLNLCSNDSPHSPSTSITSRHNN